MADYEEAYYTHKITGVSVEIENEDDSIDDEFNTDNIEDKLGEAIKFIEENAEEDAYVEIDIIVDKYADEPKVAIWTEFFPKLNIELLDWIALVEDTYGRTPSVDEMLDFCGRKSYDDEEEFDIMGCLYDLPEYWSANFNSKFWVSFYTNCGEVNFGGSLYFVCNNDIIRISDHWKEETGKDRFSWVLDTGNEGEGLGIIHRGEIDGSSVGNAAQHW